MPAARLGRLTRLLDKRPRLTMATAHGRSMEPTLHEGDRVLVLRGIGPRRGRLALVRSTADGNGRPDSHPHDIKRVSRRAPNVDGGWWVERDNPKAGVDSWQTGPVANDDVLGLVVARIPQVKLSAIPGARKATAVASALARRVRRRDDAGQQPPGPRPAAPGTHETPHARVAAGPRPCATRAPGRTRAHRRPTD